MIVLIPLFSGILLCSVYAAGVQERRLQQAEQLIEEKQYNEAIRIISDVIQTDPKRFDQGEALLKKIREARSEYNQVFEELTKMLQQEDIDENAAYALLQELRDLDKTPNKATEQILNEATAGIVFKVNDREFRRIMNEAAEKIEAGAYWEAVDLYLSGFSLHREQFELDEFGSLIENSVDSRIASLREQAAVFTDGAAVLQGIKPDLDISMGAGADSYYEEVQEAGETLLRFIVVRNAILGIAEGIEEQRQLLLQGIEGEDIPHLSTLRILSTGRENRETPEGLSGTVLTYVESIISDIHTSAMEAAGGEESSGKSALSGKNYAAGTAFFQDQYTFALADIYASELKLTILQSPQEELFSDATLSAAKTETVRLASSQETAKRAQAYITLIEIVQQAESATELFSTLNTAEELTALRPEFSRGRARLEELGEEWKSVQELLVSLESEGFSLTESIGRANDFSEELNGYISSLHEEEGQVVHRINSLFISPLEQIITDQRAEYNQASLLVQGVLPEGETDESGILRKYPSQALDIIRPVSAILLNIEAALEEKLAELAEEETFILETPVIQNDIEEMQALVAELEDVLIDVDELAVVAERDLQTAEQFKLRGESFFEDAETSLQNNDFEGALAQVDEAGEEFAKSLEYQYDPDFQEEIDVRTRNLADRITSEWQNLVVRQVRSAINEANTLYQREEFARAQTVLLRADDIWSSANAEENQEIESWLTRVENALRATTGRVILETNPLYTEMSNLLNLAQRDFQTAVDSLERDADAEADKAFSDAEEKISYIKDAFPINQAAGILQLKIDQLRDPDNFQALFRKKFEEAQAQLGTPEGAEGYSTLKDLQQINPGYPGIDQAIYQFEISLGIREPPPDPAKIREASRLYRQAQEILSKAVVTDLDFEVALDFLNEAYENNPNDRNITELKDRVQLLRGGTATVLSSDDQQKFRKAEQLFLDRRYFEALAIVERLLENPENQRYAPLNDLKRRIDSFI